MLENEVQLVMRVDSSQTDSCGCDERVVSIHSDSSVANSLVEFYNHNCKTRGIHFYVKVMTFDKQLSMRQALAT